MSHTTGIQPRARAGSGWASWLARFCMAVLIFESATGLAITFAPFHAAIQYSILFHTGVGALALVPLAWYCARHWLEYRHYAFSHIVLLGYVALLGLVVCCGTGLILMGQGIFSGKISATMRWTHLVSTAVTLAGLLPHLLLVFVKALRGEASRPAISYCWQSVMAATVAILLSLSPAWFYSGTRYVNQFSEDYHYLYGTNRPFAPSLAKTGTGGAFDARSLAGSESCGTAGCHEQILEEWKPSAHRYAAMDTVFLGIQEVMAKQNGAESTRYCGGCHDPISLFSGTKNIFVENLTGLHGYQEGVSCLSCHAIRETDVKGNANFTVTQPREYLWQWETNGLGKKVRDFLIRTYPDEHNKLSKRMFKKPEYGAACHKQFIDAEVNRVGWVQLQNQYDNWASSHWNHKGDARKTVECRECHMPLVQSFDPAAGDALDYNRSPKDKKHRSHRFIASNQLMPMALKLEGWEEQIRLTEQWLPTGPLDIIQSWLEVRVTDDRGNAVYETMIFFS